MEQLENISFRICASIVQLKKIDQGQHLQNRSGKYMLPLSLFPSSARSEDTIHLYGI
jgi:hypothetical protein